MKYLFHIMCLFSYVYVSGQINVKVGYTIGYTSGNNNQKIVDHFNTVNEAQLQQELRSIHLLYGVNVGARYMFGTWAIEASWESLANNTEGVGRIPGTESLFRKVAYYGFNNLALGMESHYSNFAIGCSIGRRRGSIKTDLPTGTDVKETLVSDSQWVVRPHISINFRGGDFIGLAIQPFLQIPLSSMSLDGFNSYLFDDPNNIPDTNSENYSVIGFSIIFYNGWQKE